MRRQTSTGLQSKILHFYSTLKNKTFLENERGKGGTRYLWYWYLQVIIGANVIPTFIHIKV
jgi:hypothetical protein